MNLGKFMYRQSLPFSILYLSGDAEYVRFGFASDDFVGEAFISTV